ncbi:MAG TPA: hypothetical protein VFX20_04760 [Steroidobacteraceae bacterium]|nr:hypothetical protein [Steroidobacteraceae bacterium]
MASPYESLSWCLGTLCASYKERLRAMSLNDPLLSKPILVLEVLTCFLASSALWAWSLRAVATQMLPAGAGLYLATAASIGPVGLVAFGRVAVGNSSSSGRHGSLALVLLAGWAAAAIFLCPGMPPPFRDMPWRDRTLFVLLPLMGAAHYHFLAHNTTSIAGESASGTTS